MKRKLSFIFLLTIALSACTNKGEHLGKWEISKRFIEGLSEIPSDKIVFLEFNFSVNCSCGCSVLEQALPQYYYSLNTLGIWIINDMILDRSSDIDSLISDAIILVGKNVLAANQLGMTNLRYFESLPIEIEHDDVTISIQSVNENGLVVIETIERHLFIGPGESRRSQTSIQPDLDRDSCFNEYDHKIMNRGLIDKSNIKYQQDYSP